MASRLSVLFLALAFTTTCQLPGASRGCTTIVDWVNFIQVGATQYVAGPDADTVLQGNELGPVYARVKFKLSGSVCDPNYRPKDGDAAFLDPGTPIYQVNGRPPSGELAAPFNGQILVYRAAKPAP